jgi:hypothetical protein
LLRRPPTSHGALRMDHTHAMPEQQMDPRKVRIGLAMVVVTVVIAIALIAVVDSALVRAIMAGIAVLGIVRAFLLYRSIRSEKAGA